MITTITSPALAGCRAPIGLAAIGLVLASAAGGASAQNPCTPTGLPFDWACEFPIWYQETPTSTPVSTNNDHLGASAAGWGDFNGDGYYDILIGGLQDPFDDYQEGSCPYPEDNTRHNKAWIVLGSGQLPCTPPTGEPACNGFPQSTVIELRDISINGRGDNLGWRWCFIGNIDGFPGDEVVVSAPLGDPTNPLKINAGIVYVISKRDGLPGGDISFDPEAGTTGIRVLRIRGLAQHDWLGFSLARGGQIVGNATLDLLIGAPGGSPPQLGVPTDPQTSGRAYAVDGALLGSALNNMTGLVADFDLAPTTNCIELKGNDAPTEVDLGMRFGISVCAIGDLDGDERNEFAVGAIESWWSCYVPDPDPEKPPIIAGFMKFLPSPKGNGRVRIFTPGSAYSAVQLDEIQGPAHEDWFGWALDSGMEEPFGAFPGDVNGDSKPDLLVGAPFSDGDPNDLVPDCGTAFLYSGADLDDGGGATPLVRIYGGIDGENAGWSVALGGNLNDDGRSEFAVGSRNFTVQVGPSDACLDDVGALGLFFRGLYVGRVRVYCGSSPYDTLLAEFWGIQFREHLGYALVWLPNMEAPPLQSTELLMTAVGHALCGGTAVPCAGNDDPRIEIGRVSVKLFH